MAAIFSRKERIIIIIFSIICITGFMLFTLIDICWNIGIVDHKNIYHPAIENSPYLNPWIILWFSMIIIFYFILKCLWVSYKVKSIKICILYIIFTAISIFYLIINTPWLLWDISPTVWIVLDIIEIGFFASFLTLATGEER